MDWNDLGAAQNNEADFLKWLEKATKQQVWEYKQRTDRQLNAYKSLMMDFEQAALKNARIATAIKIQAENVIRQNATHKLSNVCGELAAALKKLDPGNPALANYRLATTGCKKDRTRKKGIGK